MLECYIPDQYRIRTQESGAGAKLRLNTNLIARSRTQILPVLGGGWARLYLWMNTMQYTPYKGITK